MRIIVSAGLVLLLLAVLTGCSEPPAPPEVQQALNQEQDLWRAGAHIYAKGSYEKYLASLKSNRDHFSAEQARLVWFRDYAIVSTNFQSVLNQGEQVRHELLRNQAQQTADLAKRASRITERLQALRDLAAAVKDSRLNSRNLTRVAILLTEAKRLVTAGEAEAANSRLAEAEVLLDKAVSVIRPMVAHFIDEEQVARSKALVDSTIAENRRRGGHAIVVNKLRRQLALYQNGSLVETYPIGLGFNPLGDKLYSGDRATPEGRYEIIRKLPYSKFYRALLVNYPNAEDQRRFDEAKRKKLIPAKARIGGLIEIHGGGKEAATLGCIGLDDNKMLELFNRVEVGTPVVIVAAMSTDNLIGIALGRLK